MKYLIVLISLLLVICSCNKNRSTNTEEINNSSFSFEYSTTPKPDNVATTDTVKLVSKVTTETNLKTGKDYVIAQEKLYKVLTRTGVLMYFKYNRQYELLLSPLPSEYECIITYQHPYESTKYVDPPDITGVTLIKMKPRQ